LTGKAADMVTVRRAKPSDADSIALLWAADAGPTTLPGGAEEVRRLLAHDAAALLVAVVAGELEDGCAAATRDRVRIGPLPLH
jgi:hypothetical protein